MTGATPLLQIRPLADRDAPAIEALLDRAFGCGRRGRTAYRLREGTRPDPLLSAVAREPGSGALAGAILCSPIALAEPSGARHGLLLVGPVAVEPGRQGRGVGRQLVEWMLAAGGDRRPLVLIGDEPYYGRFGFTATGTGGWSLPGPVERHRLLARLPAALPAAGRLEPAPALLRRAG